MMFALAPTALGRTDPRATGSHRHLLPLRLLAGVPLLGIGLLHVLSPETPMRPLVEAAGLPLGGLLAPLAVGLELVAGASLLAGAWARFGALLAIPTMAVAAYSHVAIEEWPNAGGEPPLALPLVVLAVSAYVLWRGAGRWSLDGRSASH